MSNIFPKILVSYKHEKSDVCRKLKKIKVRE